MAILARVFSIGSSGSRIVPLESLGRMLKVSPDFKVELIDAKTGQPLKNAQVQKNQGRLTLQALADGEEIQVHFDESGEMVSNQPGPENVDLAAPDGSSESHESNSSDSGGTAASNESASDNPPGAGAEPSAGPSLGTLGVIGLGVVGLALAGGGGGGGSSSKKTPAPTGLDLAAEDDTGSSNADNLTANTSALTISGTAEANARVELFDGSTSLGSVTAGADGRFILDVSLANGVHSITAKATGTGGKVSDASQALTVTVDTSAPAAPSALDLSASDDSGTLNNDNLTSQTSGLSISGSAEANSIVELFDGATSLGTVTASANGSFTLDVSLSQGVHSITAKARDAAGNVSSSSAVLAITVDTIESESTGTLSVTGTAEEGGSLSASLSGASDPDGAITGTAYQWQISSDGTTWSNISGATAATYNLASDQSQVGKFVRVVVTTTDALGGTTTFTGDSSAAIANVNDTPTVAASQAVSTSEDTAKTVTVSGSDADGDSLTYTAGSASHGTVTGGAGGVFSYTPNSNYVGTDSFTVTVSDGNGGTATQTVNVTVTVADDEATGTLSVTGTAEEGGSLSASLSGAFDPDGTITGTAYQWQISSDGTSWSNISGATAATYSLASDQSQVGKFVRVVVTTTDASGGTTTFTGDSSAAIANVNDNPMVANAIADQNASEDSVFSFQFASNSFADADNDSLTYSAELTGGGALPAWLSFNAATRTFSGTPANGDVGTINVTVTADDGNGGTITDSFAIVVANANDAPTVVNAIADQNATQDNAFSFQFASNSFADVDGDSLTYSAGLTGGGALPAWLSFDAASRTFSGMPANGDVGTVNVTVTANDGKGGTVTDSFAIVVANTNDPPTVAASQSVSVAEDTALTVTVVGNDIDGDVLTYLSDSSSNSGNGTITGGAGGVFVYTPNSNFVGTDSFTVTVVDPDGLFVSQTVNVTVTSVDDEATGTLSVTGTAEEGGSLSASLSGASDPDGAITGTAYQWQISTDGTTWTNISGATAATYNLASDQSQVGKFVRVVVTTTDALGGTTTFTGDSSAAIANVNDAPTNLALSGSSITENTVTTGGYKIGDVSITDADTTGNNNVLTVSGTDSGLFEIRNGNELFYIGTSPNYEEQSSFNITLTATDGALSYSKDFVIAVGNVDEAGITGATTLAEGSSTALTVKVEGVADGTVISYTLSGTNITASDISGGLSGTFTVTDGVGTINIEALSDRLTEGSEQLTVTLGGAAAGIPAYNITITDVSLTPVTLANGGTYTATAGKVDTFIIDANQVITATIIGFEEGDIIEILNSSELVGVNFDNGIFNDGEATIFVSANATINLTGLSSDLFGDEASFESVYGTNAITYVI